MGGRPDPLFHSRDGDRFVLEPLEARTLLSAAPIPVVSAAPPARENLPPLQVEVLTLPSASADTEISGSSLSLFDSPASYEPLDASSNQDRAQGQPESPAESLAPVESVRPAASDPLPALASGIENEAAGIPDIQEQGSVPPSSDAFSILTAAETSVDRTVPAAATGMVTATESSGPSMAELLTGTLHAANGPPSEAEAESEPVSVPEADPASVARFLSQSGQGPMRPLILLPGIGGDFAATEYIDEWYVRRGIEPTKLQIDPLVGVYDDLIKTLLNSGYVEGQTLFVGNYDWRMQPGPIDGQIDG